MKYIQEHCNIPGCNHPIYRNYMCKEHYDFYLTDDKCRKISDDVIAVYDGKASFRQKAFSLRDNLVHHAFDYPMVRYEHFPLEHIYLLSLRYFDKHDKERCSRVIADFDIPENENIALFNRVVDIQNVNETQIKPIEQYLFSKHELISCIPVLVSLLGLTASYLLLRFGKPWTGDLLGKSFQETICLYKYVFPYIVLLILAFWSGTRLASFYNYFTQRAYKLNLFESVASNINFLNQILYVKERNKKIESYKCSMLGGFIGVCSLLFYNYFSNSTFNIYSFSLLLSGVVVLVPMLYIYNMTVLYFPVFEALKRNRLKIDLYNPDHNGGLSKAHDFLFKTFVYNEVLVFVLLWFCMKASIWWLWIIVSLGLIMRTNHVGWSLKLYIAFIRDFCKAKKAEKEKLLLQNDEIAFDKIEKLDKLYTTKISKHVRNLFLIVVLPYLINNADNIFNWIVTSIPAVWNKVMLK